MLAFKKIIIILVYITYSVISWELKSIGIDDFSLLHAKSYLVRVFLCIKISNTTSSLGATLIESTWPENYFSLLPKIFPDKELHALTILERDNCFLIHQAIQTEIDDLFRLWVLDEGNDHCEPKILIYDLLRRNREVARISCQLLFGKKIISMKLDPNTECHSKYEVYITVDKESKIYIYNIYTELWRMIELTAKDDEVRDLMIPVKPTFFVFLGKPRQLYITDSFGNLYFGKFNLPNETYSNVDSQVIRKLGVLLGEPKALTLDPMGMVYYIVQKFGVVVRWISYKGVLKAEEHEILYFSQSESELAQIFFGSMGSVWVVRSRFTKNKDHCTRILYHYMLQSNTSDVI